MRYWVLGSKGMLGQAVVKALGEKEVLATDRQKADILSLGSLRKCADDFHPDVILNCAAYTAVDAAEEHEAEAMAINRDGVRNIAQIAKENSCRLIHVSTDYVFDGQASTPYSEEQPCSPTGAYGRTKLEGEKEVEKVLEGKGIVLRTSWLFGPGGNNFVKTMVRLMLSRSELGVVSDQRGRPTYTDDLAQAMIALSRPKDVCGLYHFANARETSWYGFAQAILQIVGEDAICQNIKPLQTREYPTPALRPAYSVLKTQKISGLIEPRSWLEPLEGYVKSLVKELKENTL